MAIYEAQYVGSRILAWENYTSTATPLSAGNLNKIQATLEGIDTNALNAFNVLDQTKADKDTVNGLVNSVQFNDQTGVFTFGQVGGTSITINTVLEKVPASFAYDTQTEKLVIVNTDGTTVQVDLSTIIQQTEFVDSNTIAWTINADGTMSASVKDGSITDAKIEQHYLALVTAQANAANASAINSDYYAKLSKSYANGTSNLEDRPTENVDNSYYYSQQSKTSSEDSEAWAVGTRNGTDVPSTDPTYENNAEYWAHMAEQMSGQAVFEGATSTNNGVRGLVPDPLIADRNKVLKGDGTWGESEGTQQLQSDLITTQDNIADVEVSPAVAAHAVDEQIMYNNVLYTVMSAISIGDTLTVGTNIVESERIVEQLKPFTGATSQNDGDVGTVPAPSAGDGGKVLYGDGAWGDIPTMTGATASDAGAGGLVPQPLAGDEDKVLQGNGTFGKKLQIDVVIQNNQYGYIGANNTFIPFKSQADIDAAVSAAKVGNATAADVLAGKTFTNSTTSGVTGTMVDHDAATNAVSVGTNNTNTYHRIPTGAYLKLQGTGYPEIVTPLTTYGNAEMKDVLSGKTFTSSAGLMATGTLVQSLSLRSPRMRTNRIISNSKWSTKTWSGNLTNFRGNYIWTDGNNIYYSDGSTQYVFNKSTSTWTAKTWSGLTSLYGSEIWTDGNNIYHSSESNQYVLNKSTSTWSTKTWSGLTNFSRDYIWTDGDNIYFSNVSKQYVLNKSNSTWSTKTWSGYSSLDGIYIWTDGDNIYYSYGSTQYVLNKSNSTWTAKTWSGLTNFRGSHIWSDGNNIYYSNGSTQYVLNKSNSTWTAKTWSGLTNFYGGEIWTDGNNIYYSYSSNQYVLNNSSIMC